MVATRSADTASKPAARKAAGSGKKATWKGIALADIKAALELEKLRQKRLFTQITNEQSAKASAILRDFSQRGYERSGQVGVALLHNLEAHWERLVEGQIEIRRELAASCPELREDAALDELLSESHATINRVFYVPPRGGQFPVADQGGPSRGPAGARLRDRVTREIEILKKEFALGLDKKAESHHSVSVNTAGGPAIVNLGEIHGHIQQVTGTLNAGSPDVAAAIERVADVIRSAEALGDRRQEYLEQVEFLAEQAAIEPAQRKAGRIKGMLLALRVGLADVANVSQVLSLAGPVLAKYFGLDWPA